MDLSAVFSDDQIAITGCFVALAACAAVAAISFHFGPAGKESPQGTARLKLKAVPQSSPESQQKKAA